MKSIPTRDGLNPPSKIVKKSADPAKAKGGVTAETYVVPARPKRIEP